MRTGDRRRPSQQGGNLPSTSNGAFSSQYPLIDRESPFDASFTGTNDIESPHASLAFEAHSDVIPQFSHNFANVRVHASAPETMQAKLTVNQPGDSHEQEADQVADQVMRMEAPGPSEAPPGSGDAKLEANNLLTQKGTSDTSEHETTSVPPLVDEMLSSGGSQPLDDSTRSFMEPRFGHDFSRVRIHTDERAGESAQSVNALAYTVGQDVVFGAGHYAPGTNEGKKLLAHELTHVVQQTHTLLHANNIVSAVALSRVSPNLVQRDVDPEKPGPWMHSEKENWPSSEPRAYSDLIKSVEERKSNIIASLDRPPKTDQETEQFKHQVRRLIRITALQMLVQYRATIQNKEDEFLNESSQESTQQNTKSGTAGRQSTDAIRTANVALLRLNNLKEELEEYANNLGSISTLTSSDAEMNFENWLIELRENTRVYRSPAVEQDLDYLTRKIRRGNPGPDERVLVWRIAQHEKEWRQKQITAVDMSLRELYLTFPFFTRLKPDVALSVAPDQLIKREATKGYMELLKNIDSVTTKISSGNIDEFSLPAAVDAARNSLPAAVQAPVDQLRTELQQQRLQEETGLQILQAVIVLLPVIGPLAASTLGIVQYGASLKEMIDTNEISKASITLDQNVLGVSAPNALDLVLETVNGILTAVDLVGTLHGLGGDFPKKAAYEPKEESGGSGSGKSSTGQPGEESPIKEIVSSESAEAGRGVGTQLSDVSGGGGQNIPPKLPPSIPQNVLVVGAETEGEFSYATEVAGRGHQVTVVNPRSTAEAEAYVSRGGNFLQVPVEELPNEPVFDIIREDFPFPLGRAFQPTAEFASERLSRLAPGGRWVVVTEAKEFATTLEAVAPSKGMTVTVKEFPLYHEGAPQSVWPKDTSRFVLIFEKSK